MRLRELLGDMPPGKPAISIAVGEPQHPMPAFVGPVIAAHLARVRPLSDEQGPRRILPAPSPNGSAGAIALPRPIDPATEVLVLNGSREGLFLAAIAAQRWVSGRAPAGRRC